MSFYGELSSIEEGAIFKSKEAKDIEKRLKAAIKENDVKLGLGDTIKKASVINLIKI